MTSQSFRTGQRPAYLFYSVVLLRIKTKNGGRVRHHHGRHKYEDVDVILGEHTPNLALFTVSSAMLHFNTNFELLNILFGHISKCIIQIYNEHSLLVQAIITFLLLLPACSKI